MNRLSAEKPLCCLTNPFLRHDAEPLKQAETPKKIMVIGGGVAGLCAAFVTKERGHEVTLYEAGEKLGRNMRLAAYPPGKGDITNMIRSYIHRCQKDGVEIKLNHEVTADFIKEETPDSVILATGSRTPVLPIEGIDHPSIIYGSDLLEGKRAAGKKVLVVGGGMVGCETADGEHHEARDYDFVVLSMGYRNYNPLEEQVKAIIPDTYVIGDAIRVRRAMDVTKEAYDVASQI